MVFILDLTFIISDIVLYWFIVDFHWSQFVLRTEGRVVAIRNTPSPRGCLSKECHLRWIVPWCYKHNGIGMVISGWGEAPYGASMLALFHFSSFSKLPIWKFILQWNWKRTNDLEWDTLTLYLQSNCAHVEKLHILFTYQLCYPLDWQNKNENICLKFRHFWEFGAIYP